MKALSKKIYLELIYYFKMIFDDKMILLKSAQFYKTYRLNLLRQQNTVQLRNKRKICNNKIGSELGSSK